MGIKRNFSKDPVDYIKVRKSDKKKVPKRFLRKFDVEEIDLNQSKITCIRRKRENKLLNKLILYIPGGAFISGPAAHHWNAIEHIATETKNSIWLVNYPKSPEYNIEQISHNIELIFTAALKQADADQLILIGDSVGATLIMALVQRLVSKKKKVPSKLILITPVFDSSLTNKEIENLDNKDPMLSKVGVVSAKKMCAQEMSLTDPMMSPLYGDFTAFPKTTVFLGGRDIMAPDGMLGSKKMKQAAIDLNLIYEPEMPHIYPLLPMMKESKEGMLEIIKQCR